MKILLVSQEKSVDIIKRIVDEAKIRSHEIDHVYYENLKIVIGKKTQIFFNNKKCGKYNAVLLRMASPDMVYHKDILARHFNKKSFVVNCESFITWPYLGKLFQNYYLNKCGVDSVKSVSLANKNYIKEKFPLILKLNFGRLGKGVLKINAKKNFPKNVNNFAKYLVQPFIEGGVDYRVIVIGKKALGFAMKKTAAKGKFLTNIHQGGRGEKVELNAALKKIAEKSAKIFKSDYCGVDVIYEKGLPKVLEINRSANFLGFEKVTKINVAGQLMLYLEKNAK